MPAENDEFQGIARRAYARKGRAQALWTALDWLPTTLVRLRLSPHSGNSAIRAHPFHPATRRTSHTPPPIYTRGKKRFHTREKRFHTEKKSFHTGKDSGHTNSTNNTKQQKRHSLHSCYSCYSCSVKTQPRLPRHSGSVTRKRGLSVCSRRRISFMRATISGCCAETSWSSWRSAARL